METSPALVHSFAASPSSMKSTQDAAGTDSVPEPSARTKYGIDASWPLRRVNAVRGSIAGQRHPKFSRRLVDAKVFLSNEELLLLLVDDEALLLQPDTSRPGRGRKPVARPNLLGVGRREPALSITFKSRRDGEAGPLCLRQDLVEEGTDDEIADRPGDGDVQLSVEHDHGVGSRKVPVSIDVPKDVLVTTESAGPSGLSGKPTLRRLRFGHDRPAQQRGYGQTDGRVRDVHRPIRRIPVASERVEGFDPASSVFPSKRLKTHTTIVESGSCGHLLGPIARVPGVSLESSALDAATSQCQEVRRGGPQRARRSCTARQPHRCEPPDEATNGWPVRVSRNVGCRRA